MVTNKDIQKEFKVFSAVWSFYKEMLPVHSEQDDAYWQQVLEGADEICQIYPSDLCRDFVLVILKDLERKGKEYDCKTTKSNRYQVIS